MGSLISNDPLSTASIFKIVSHYCLISSISSTDGRNISIWRYISIYLNYGYIFVIYCATDSGILPQGVHCQRTVAYRIFVPSSARTPSSIAVGTIVSRLQHGSNSKYFVNLRSYQVDTRFLFITISIQIPWSSESTSQSTHCNDSIQVSLSIFKYIQHRFP